MEEADSSSLFQLAVWGSGRIVENVVVALLELAVLITCLLQLYRIRHRSQLTRLRFSAKRAFFALLASSMFMRDVWLIFFLSAPCYVKDNGLANYCFILDNLWQDINSTLFFLCYLATVLFWADFVHMMRHSSSASGNKSDTGVSLRVLIPLIAVTIIALLAAVIYAILILSWARNSASRRDRLEDATLSFFAVMYISIGSALAWYGWSISIYVRRAMVPDAQPPTAMTPLMISGAPPAAVNTVMITPLRRSKQALKILCVAFSCSMLLLARAIWNIVEAATPSAVLAGSSWNPLKDFAYEFLFEIVPACLMLALMWPLPKSVLLPSHLYFQRSPGTQSASAQSNDFQ